MPSKMWRSRKHIAQTFLDYVDETGEMVLSNFGDTAGGQIKHAIYDAINSRGNRFFTGYRDLLFEVRKLLRSQGRYGETDKFQYDNIPRKRYKEPRHWTNDLIDYATIWICESANNPEKTLRSRRIQEIFRSYCSACNRYRGGVQRVLEDVGRNPKDFRGSLYWDFDEIFRSFSRCLDTETMTVNPKAIYDADYQLYQAIMRRVEEWPVFIELARQRFEKRRETGKAERCTPEALARDQNAAKDTRYEVQRKHKPGREKVKAVNVRKDYSVRWTASILGVSQNNVYELESDNKLDMVVGGDKPRVSGRSIANFLELESGWLKPGQVAKKLDISDATVRLNKIPAYPQHCVKIVTGRKFEYLITPDKLDCFRPETSMKRISGYSIEDASRNTDIGAYRIRNWVRDGLLYPTYVKGIAVFQDSDLALIESLSKEVTAHLENLKRMLDDDIDYTVPVLVSMGFPFGGLWHERVKGRVRDRSSDPSKPLFRGHDLKRYLDRYNNSSYFSKLRGEAAECYHTIYDSSSPQRIGLPYSMIRGRCKRLVEKVPEAVLRLAKNRKIYTLIPESSFYLFKGEDWKPCAENVMGLQRKDISFIRARTKAAIDSFLEQNETEIFKALAGCRSVRKAYERENGLQLRFVRDMGHLLAMEKYDGFMGRRRFTYPEAIDFFDTKGWSLENEEAIEQKIFDHCYDFIAQETEKKNISIERRKIKIKQCGERALSASIKNFDITMGIPFERFARICIDKLFDQEFGYARI